MSARAGGNAWPSGRKCCALEAMYRAIARYPVISPPVRAAVRGSAMLLTCYRRGDRGRRVPRADRATMPRKKPPRIAKSIQTAAISNTTLSQTIDAVITVPARSSKPLAVLTG
jgi:hypothetical protein